jgi:hypothetical protein
VDEITVTRDRASHFLAEISGSVEGLFDRFHGEVSVAPVEYLEKGNLRVASQIDILRYHALGVIPRFSTWGRVNLKARRNQITSNPTNVYSLNLEIYISRLRIAQIIHYYRFVVCIIYLGCPRPI